MLARRRGAGRPEPAAAGGAAGRRGPLRDAGDGPRVRAGAAGGERRGGRDAAARTPPTSWPWPSRRRPSSASTDERPGWSGSRPSTTTCARRWPGSSSAASRSEACAWPERCGSFWYFRGHLQRGAPLAGARPWPPTPPGAAGAAGVRAWALIGSGVFAQVQGRRRRGRGPILPRAWRSTRRPATPRAPPGAQHARRRAGQPGALRRGGRALRRGRWTPARARRRVWIGHALFHLGVVAYAGGDASAPAPCGRGGRALRRDGAPLARRRPAGLPRPDRLRRRRPRAGRGAVRRHPGPAAGAGRTVRGCRRPRRASRTLAAARGEPDRAARLFGAAEACARRTGGPFPLPARDTYEAAMAARARRPRATSGFAAALDAGRTLTLEQALAAAGGVLAPRRPEPRRRPASAPGCPPAAGRRRPLRPDPAGAGGAGPALPAPDRPRDRRGAVPQPPHRRAPTSPTSSASSASPTAARPPPLAARHGLA